MRAASAMSTVETPRSAARAGSGRMTTSGRNSAAEVLTEPSPGSERMAAASSREVLASSSESLPVRPSVNRSPGPPAVNWVRIPGISFNSARTAFSSSGVRRLRSAVNSRVNTILRTSGKVRPPPMEPSTSPPMVVKTLLISGTPLRRRDRTSAATARESARRAPGGNSTCSITRCASVVGRKVFGMSGIRASEAMKVKSARPSAIRRWCKARSTHRR